MKCKNCGHELEEIEAKTYAHKKVILISKLKLWCCGHKIGNGVFCGCIKPEPEECDK